MGWKQLISLRGTGAPQGTGDSAMLDFIYIGSDYRLMAYLVVVAIVVGTNWAVLWWFHWRVRK